MNGILLIDKPRRMTSHDIIRHVRKVLDIKRIGHAGTLDPFATGLLVVMVGWATKLSDALIAENKTYEATIRLGISTDTDDLTGKTIQVISARHLDETCIRTALCSFIGRTMQRPPIYAAIKVQGKKLYEYARAEQELPDIPLRQIHIDQISDISLSYVGEDVVDIHFTIQVSKGTYIRSLARDVGEKLGIVGTLKDLRRTASGMFRLDEAITLDEVTPSMPLIDPLPYLGYAQCRLADLWLKKVENGAFLPMSLFSDSANTIIYNALDEPLAIYRYDKERDCMRMSVKLQ